MSTWPVPRDTSPWAAGTDTTCRLQGFFTQNSIISSFYNANLSVYFYLVIVRHWKEGELQRIERAWLHGVPLLAGLFTSILGLVLGAYGDALLWCWVADDQQVFRWAAYYVPLWTNIFIVTACCVAIYRHVRQLDQRHQNITTRTTTLAPPMDDTMHGMNASQRDHVGVSRLGYQEQEEEEEVMGQPSAINDVTVSNDDQNVDTRRTVADLDQQNGQETVQREMQQRRHSYTVHHRRVKQVAQQCFLYAAAFYINWTSLTAVRLIQAFGGETVPYSLMLISAITVPIQGLPNFLVYLRPKLQLAYRKWRAGYYRRNHDDRTAARTGLPYGSRHYGDDDVSMSRRHATTVTHGDNDNDSADSNHGIREMWDKEVGERIKQPEDMKEDP